jgi:hypothetical protein
VYGRDNAVPWQGAKKMKTKISEEDWTKILDRHRGGGLPDVELHHLLDPEEDAFQHLMDPDPERAK